MNQPFAPFFVTWSCHDVVLDVLRRGGVATAGARVLAPVAAGQPQREACAAP